MASNVGRGIIAPDNNDNIGTGASEMRTLGATTAAAISDVDVRVSSELAQKIGKTEAYQNLVPRDEAVRYGIAGPRGPEGPVSNVPGPPGPGGSIALEETDPGCFVDSEITWMQWPQSGGLPAVWNPNTQSYENPITVDTSVGTRVFVGDTMIYGDTGLRAISQWSSDGDVEGIDVPGIRPLPNFSGGVYIRRIGEDVTVFITNAVATGENIRIPLPSRFNAGSNPNPTGLIVVNDTEYVAYKTGTQATFIRGLNDGDRLPGEALYGVEMTWKTTQNWPTSLPGLPA